MDPALLLLTAAQIPREAAQTQNLLVQNPPVEHPVNTLASTSELGADPSPSAPSLLANVYQRNMKKLLVSSEDDIIDSASENTRTSPKKSGGLKHCTAGKETPQSV